MVRPALFHDAAAIAEIYNTYIRETTITFEEEPVSAADMGARLREIAARLPFLVFEAGHQVAGYAYAKPWRPRSAYRYSVESTVYVASSHRGHGIGPALYDRLIADLRSAHLHCVIGGIALPNEASVKLHERLGFEKVAHFAEVGFKFGRWIDVGYWQLRL